VFSQEQLILRLPKIAILVVCVCDCMYKINFLQNEQKSTAQNKQWRKMGIRDNEVLSVLIRSPTNVYSKPSAWNEQHRKWANSLCTSVIPLDVTVC